VLLETIDTLVVVLDATGRIVLANRALENLLDLSVEKMLGATPFELGVARLDPCADDAGGDVQVRSASGQLRLVAWTSHMVRGADGALQYVVATGTDVTEARATEARLRESEQRFRELAENVNDLVAELDENGVFTYVNKQFEKVLGWPAESFVGRPVGEHAPDRPALARAGLERLRAPRRRAEACCGFATGTATTAVSRSWCAASSGQGRVRIAMIARHQQARPGRGRAAPGGSAGHAGTFAAGVAHEINNPVAAILLAAERRTPRARGPKPGRDHHAREHRRPRAAARDQSAMLDREPRALELHAHETNELVGRALSLVSPMRTSTGRWCGCAARPAPC
jgi:PAS domain S-box-containing protein